MDAYRSYFCRLSYKDYGTLDLGKSIYNPMLFAVILKNLLHFQMIPVLCLTAIGTLVFLPNDYSQITSMLRGLSAGIVVTANLILIRRFVISKLRKNAVALSCAFRLISSVVMPMTKEIDEVYQGSILIGVSLLSGLLIICCGMNKSKDRVWDEYYESYFERNSKTSDEEEESVFYKFRYFLLILGMRIPGLLINNNVIKTIQLSFLQSFSPTLANLYFITTLACTLLLLMTAFNHPSAKNPSTLKFLIIPASYIAFIMLLVNVPLIYVYLQQHGGFSLMAIILINFLLDVVFSAGIFYLLDTLLVQSDLSGAKLSFIIAIEIILLTAIERLVNHSTIQWITLQGFYSILTLSFLVPMFLYHKRLDRS